jgi:hypothetical protein
MARQISEIQSLPFYQIIGAPLLALVQGQAQAAQTTAEFIERVGFMPPGTPGPGNDIGGLRMVAFQYQKPGPDGTQQTFRAEVPLLSLVPIPAIEVKSAEFDFTVKITDVFSVDTATALSSPDADANDWLSQGRVEFRGAMGRMQTSSSDSQTLDLQMKVNIKVGPPDTTSGMAHLFRLFDQATNSSSVEKPITASTPSP